MALVGEAHIIVKAITNGVAKDISRVFNDSGMNRSASKSGNKVGNSFSAGVASGTRRASISFSQLSQSIGELVPNGTAALGQFRAMVTQFNFMAPAVNLVFGAIAALGGGILALVGAIGGGAIAAVVGLAGALGSLGVAAAVGMTALSGVGKAVSAYFAQQNNASKKAADTAKAVADAQRRLALAQEAALERLVDANKRVEMAQRSYTDAIREGAEELQQLSFDSEDAAIAEQRAAVELEKARETLIRTADLPPNSRARKEAQLAFQEADLNLRRAKDRVVDLNKEQDRIANQGNMTDRELSAIAELNEANKNLAKTERDNARSIIEAQEAITEAKKPNSAGAGDDPFAGLTESQKKFAEFLVGLVPKYKELKELAAAGFLPLLKEQIEELDKTYFPILKSRIGAIATELGNATGEIKTKLLDPTTVAAFDSALQKLGVEGGPISKIGSIAGTTGQLLIEFFDMSLPYADELLGKIDENLEKFRDWMREIKGNGAFDEFMSRATPALDSLGTILLNTIGAIGTIINANIGPGTGGQKLLDWLADVTGGFANMTGAEFGELKTTFSELADTFMVIAGLVGDILGIFVDLALDADVQAFFQQMRDELVPIIESIVTKLGDVSGGFGDIVIEAGKFIDNITHTEGINIFFDTLTGFIKPINDFLASDAGQRILTLGAQIAGFVTALALLGKGASFAFSIASGSVQQLTGFIGGTQAVFGGLRDSFKAFGETMDLQKVLAQMGGVDASALTLKDKFTDLRIGANGAFDSLSNSGNGFLKVIGNIGKAFMTNPWLLVIGLVIGALATLYMNSEEFRKMIDNLFKFVMDLFAQAWEVIKPLWDGLTAAVDELIQAFAGDGSGLLPIMDLVITVIKQIINQFVFTATVIATIIIPIITTLIKIFTGVVTVVNAIIKTIAAFIEALFTGDWKKFQKVFEGIWAEVGVMMMKLWTDIQNAFINMINALIKAALQFVKNSPFAGLVSALLEAASTFFGGKKINLDAAIKLADKGLVAKVEYPAAVKQLQAKSANAAGSDVRLANKAKTTQEINVASLTSTTGMPNITSALGAASKTAIPMTGNQAYDSAQIKAATAKVNLLMKEGKTEEAKALAAQTQAALKQAKSVYGSSTATPPSLTGGVALPTTGAYSNYPSTMSAAPSNPVTINVYPSEGMDEQEIAAIVSREIALQLRKGALV